MNIFLTTGRKTTPAGSERHSNMVATLLNMESLCDQFKLGQNNSPTQQTNTATPNSTAHNQNNSAQAAIDPEEITVCFENEDSQGAQNSSPNTPAHSAKPVDKQGDSNKSENPRNLPWFSCQDLKDVLPKRVSFNDIPDVIASREYGNERFLANHEAGWNSHYCEDDTRQCKYK